MLTYFIGGCLNAHTTWPINIFKIEQTLCILEKNIEFQELCKQAPPTEEVHVQQGKTHANFSSISNLKY